MSLFQRAATLAAVTLMLAGAVHSTAGNAAELDRSAQATTAAPVPTVQPAVLVTPITPLPAAIPAPSATVAPEADPAAGDVVAYPTLAAAVAAQDASAASDEQLRCLATAIYFESKGEPLAGQLAVAQVILNRAASGRFGSDACSVVTQRGQFSFVRGGVVPSVDAGRAQYRTAVAVAKVAMADAWDGQADNALYFHARRVAPGWKKTRVAAIGNHVFYR
jgi:N-acetylmuramoyl-L-alanine amidase